MIMPATQMKRANPTLPLRAMMLLGVEKIPVPIMRLKMLQWRSASLLGQNQSGGSGILQKDGTGQTNGPSRVAGLIDLAAMLAVLGRLSVGRRGPLLDGIDIIPLAFPREHGDKKGNAGGQEFLGGD